MYRGKKAPLKITSKFGKSGSVHGQGVKGNCKQSVIHLASPASGAPPEAKILAGFIDFEAFFNSFLLDSVAC